MKKNVNKTTADNTEKNSQSKKRTIKLGDIVLLTVSLVVAVILWAYVTYDNKNDYTKTFEHILVEVREKDALPDGKALYSIIENRYASVEITGKRSRVEDIDKNDIAAYIDIKKAINGVTEFGSENPIPVVIEFSIKKTGEFKIKPTTDSPTVISVVIDQKEERWIPLTVGTPKYESMPSNYFFGKSEIMNVAQIRLVGALEEIKNIDHAVVKINVGTVTGEFTSTQPITLIDKNGREANNKVTSGYIEINGAVGADDPDRQSPDNAFVMTDKENNTDVTVITAVYMKKTLPLVIAGKYGKLGEGAAEISFSPIKGIEVFGVPDVFAGDKGIKEIPIGVIDERKIISDTYTESFKFKLPDGVSLMPDATLPDGIMNDRVEFTVAANVKMVDSRVVTLTLQPENVIVKYSPETFFGDTKIERIDIRTPIELMFRVPTENDVALYILTSSDIIITLDFTGMTEWAESLFSIPCTVELSAEAKRVGVYEINVPETRQKLDITIVPQQQLSLMSKP